MTAFPDVPYDRAVAGTLAASLRNLATAIDAHAKARASLNASLLGDCWQGVYRQQYIDAFKSQSTWAGDLCGQLVSLAAAVDNMTFEAQAAQARITQKRIAAEKRRLERLQ